MCICMLQCIGHVFTLGLWAAYEKWSGAVVVAAAL
jgi:hypothetical protein